MIIILFPIVLCAFASTASTRKNTETGIVTTMDFETGFEDWEIENVSLLKLTDNILGITPGTGGGQVVAMAGSDQEGFVSRLVNIATDTTLQIEVSIFVTGYESEDIFLYENPSFRIFLITKDKSVNFKVFDLSENKGVKNGVWKSYRYSLKSNSEINSLTVKFIAKSGQKDRSVIAWDDIKLEYVEPVNSNHQDGEGKHITTLSMTSEDRQPSKEDSENDTITKTSEAEYTKPSEQYNKEENTTNVETTEYAEPNREDGTEESNKNTTTNGIEPAGVTDNLTMENGKLTKEANEHENETNHDIARNKENMTITDSNSFEEINSTDEMLGSNSSTQSSSRSFLKEEAITTMMSDSASTTTLESTLENSASVISVNRSMIEHNLSATTKKENQTNPSNESHTKPSVQTTTQIILSGSNSGEGSAAENYETTLEDDVTILKQKKADNMTDQGKTSTTSLPTVISSNSTKKAKNNIISNYNSTINSSALVQELTTSTPNTASENTTKSQMTYQNTTRKQPTYQNTTSPAQLLNTTWNTGETATLNAMHSTLPVKIQDPNTMITYANSKNAVTDLDDEATKNSTTEEATQLVENTEVTPTKQTDLTEATLSSPYQDNPYGDSSDGDISDQTVALTLGLNRTLPGNHSIIYRVFTQVFNIVNSSNFSINIRIP